jgi:hypothetical protein
MNCSCKLCSPEELQSEVKAEVKKENAVVKKEAPVPVPVPAAPPTQDSNPTPYKGPYVEIPAKPSPTVRRTPSTSTPTTASPRPLQASPLPPPRTEDQQLDSTFGRFTFRPGELVWFDRGGAETWGLGIIVRRWNIAASLSPNNNKAYLLQPVSHPYDAQPQKVITQEAQIRPWLAWSPPEYMHAPLRGVVPEVTFENADWNGLMRGEYGPGDLTIDGSILAAKQIDTSYTPFQLLQSNPSQTETHWNGIFVGAEKLWVGEPARLRIGTDETVILIHDIIEKTSQFGGGAGAVPTKSIALVGDIYTSATASTPMAQPPNLPNRMTADHEQRNQITASSPNPAQRTYHFWRLSQPSTSVSLNNIKGRWYEWFTMLPILRSRAIHDHQSNIAQGIVEPVGQLLNARSECGHTSGTKRNDRNLAFGRSVPPTVQIKDGVEVPPPNELPVELVRQPPPQQQMVHHQGGSQFVSGVGNVSGPHSGMIDSAHVEPPVELDDFMNLDGIESGDWTGSAWVP